MKTKKSSKKRAALELDTPAIKDKVEIGHGETADGVLVDQDLNEPTMGEKLASLNIVPDDRVASQNKEGSSLHAKPPSADSVHILLKQALHADDRALLFECLYTQDEKVIAKSVSQLNPAGVLKLLQSLISLIESRGAILACALPWLRSLLLQHASGIVSQESSLSALNSLYQLIESRVSTFQSALQLSSVLDLLYTGVVDDLDDENGTTGPVIYEDKDSDEEESEDAMETDQDDEDGEDLDAELGGVSDFEGIEGLDDLSD
ncbi:putative small-subunit processome, Utp12 protein [Rosa chinensis]|uniref:Putative small-subunit processome, Utp12 protein n=2 Tax=Rosa chinensis TaxID=74649 RepID=A0A2P6SBN5_ROSCH|nr:WD repeat-containing protein 43 isoform X2 [Rosa chinensis]XP_024176432.1 WD repeat-containing protein 43 isoform X2 [Rosa chinensis]XP_024176433.1 WD repeat-containing protein 43 isoform X2 [Rosa chinensis]XP_024176434.1 WD repeat-containing protein 43 isoform X2 [Rosa chinensis]XP_024176435.1 WD repeat-containing protein 43 isoform X2 [Rosa chinensis]XP_040368782.1 WD repeat-containing protein 43 isoform X2 [Rosa chinensis]PRQ56069.1 putative small-subunit processome, Utp12 protein [Rosa